MYEQENEAGEVGGGQIMKVFMHHDKDFTFYSLDHKKANKGFQCSKQKQGLQTEN